MLVLDFLREVVFLLLVIDKMFLLYNNYISFLSN